MPDAIPADLRPFLDALAELLADSLLNGMAADD